MEKRVSYYVSRKSFLVWLSALVMTASAALRIAYSCGKGADASTVWFQIVLPAAACLIFVLMILLGGEERFYRTAIPAFMLAIYYSVRVSAILPSLSLRFVFWVAYLAMAGLYAATVSGRLRNNWALVLLLAAAIAVLAYTHRMAFTGGNWSGRVGFLPELLFLTGGFFAVLAMQPHADGKYHPTWGDRVDGRRIRSLPPANYIIPYIMVNRTGSSNLFEEAFEITNVDRYIRQKRREGLTNFGIMHVFLTAYCRGVAKYPGVNRFIAGQKIYSRGEDIQFCMTIKKDMTTDGAETEIKLHLSPRDTVYDVYKKMNDAIVKVKNTPLDAGVDNTAYALTMIPGVVLKFFVWFLKTLDYFGLLPKFLLEVSPFHGSIFFTSMGSLGIPPVYHHLYDFGNLPVFGSFGCKRRALELQEDGTVVQRKYIDFRFTLDERTVDGFYYAAFLKYYKRLIQHPEVLDEAPAEIVKDMD